MGNHLRALVDTTSSVASPSYPTAPCASVAGFGKLVQLSRLLNVRALPFRRRDT